MSDPDDFTNTGGGGAGNRYVADNLVGAAAQGGDVHSRLAAMSGFKGSAALTETQTKLPTQTRPEKEVACVECGQMILGEAIETGANHYHAKCFKCNECKKSITDAYVLAGNFPFCKPCGAERQRIAAHNASVAAMGAREKTSNADELARQRARNDALKANAAKGKSACLKCGVPFKATDFNVCELDDGTVHAACFTCAECAKPIEGGYTKRAGGVVVCAACVGKGSSSGANCGSCAKPVAGGQYVKAGESLYHKDCFKCATCSASLSGGYAVVAGKPACGSCAGKAQRAAKKTTTSVGAAPGAQRGLRVNPVTGKVTKGGSLS